MINVKLAKLGITYSRYCAEQWNKTEATEGSTRFILNIHVAKKSCSVSIVTIKRGALGTPLSRITVARLVNFFAVLF